MAVHDSLACYPVHLMCTDVLPVNHLTTNDAFWHCLTLAACYQLAQSVLKIDFALAKNSGIGGGGQAYSRHTMHMVAALDGYRTASVGTGWTISHLVSTNGPETTPLPL